MHQEETIMGTRAPPMGCIAGTLAVAIVIVAAAVWSASARAADVQVRIDSLNIAPYRLTADVTQVRRSLHSQGAARRDGSHCTVPMARSFTSKSIRSYS